MSDSFKLTGKIIKIDDTQTFASGFSKREFVVETEGEYSQPIKLAFVKDKTDILDKFTTGQEVEVGFNLRGNEHEGRYYVDLQAWKIYGADQASNPETVSAPQSQPQARTTVLDDDGDGSEIPF